MFWVFLFALFGVVGIYYLFTTGGGRFLIMLGIVYIWGVEYIVKVMTFFG